MEACFGGCLGVSTHLWDAEVAIPTRAFGATVQRTVPIHHHPRPLPPVPEKIPALGFRRQSEPSYGTWISSVQLTLTAVLRHSTTSDHSVGKHQQPLTYWPSPSPLPTKGAVLSQLSKILRMGMGRRSSVSQTILSWFGSKGPMESITFWTSLGGGGQEWIEDWGPQDEGCMENAGATQAWGAARGPAGRWYRFICSIVQRCPPPPPPPPSLSRPFLHGGGGGGGVIRHTGRRKQRAEERMAWWGQGYVGITRNRGV